MSARSTLQTIVAPLALVAALALVAFAAPAGAQTSGPPPAPDAVVAPGAVEPLSPPSLMRPPVPQPRPFVMAPAPEKPKRVPLAKHWWFWAGLGGAAVGVVLAALFLGPRDPYVGNANPGMLSTF